jgi:acetyltransferase-like isoleucine patch superfamily enzyme
MVSGDSSARDITLAIRQIPFMLKVAGRINGRIRSLWFKLRLGAMGMHVGKRVSVGRGVQVIASRGTRCHIGDGVSFGAGVILNIGANAIVHIGNNVRITHYTLIGAQHSISIEDRAQVGEHCSIRDHEHDYSAPSMHGSALVCSPVIIGEDSWIGRGVAVLKGARIGAGAVVGANAVVRGDIPQDAIAVGVPARIIRMRR